MRPLAWEALRRRRRSILLTMGCVIAAVALGFGFVVYPWGMLLMPGLDVWTLLKEVYPLAALLLLTVLFLADMVRAYQHQELVERDALESSDPNEGTSDQVRDLAREVTGPLGRIITESAELLDLLSRNGSESEEMRRLLETVRREAERAQSMIDPFRMPAGPDTGRSHGGSSPDPATGPDAQRFGPPIRQ